MGKKKARKKLKAPVYKLTPSELKGLYSTAYLATWAGEQFGGGITGAECAIVAAQTRAEELGVMATIADRLYNNATDGKVR